MSEPLKPRIDFDGPLQAEKIPPLKSARAFDTLEADNFAPARLVTGEEEEGAAEAVVETAATAVIRATIRILSPMKENRLTYRMMICHFRERNI